jgi:formylglycine-generating enzyme required for sulfatase activity/tRNA A-37 threonylcarbamoyl transferase component Bud32
MPGADADRNLLFGVLALQMDFVSREALIAAVSTWALDKCRPLDQILVAQGALAADEHALLEPLVRKHLEKHGGDPERSLAAASAIGALHDDLHRIADPAVQATLRRAAAALPPAGDSDATRTYRAGQATSGGTRFCILRPHARGGLGEVSVALDRELNREVALKEIQPSYADDPDSRARFLLEAEITGALEHPGIVPVYGLGHYPDGRPFYAMRFIRGESLKEAIARFHRADVPGRDTGERTLALRQLLGRFIEVCNAITYAHSRGVIHRDLKPGNIMLGKYGETLVVDWGLAKPLGRSGSQDDAAERTLRPSSVDGSASTQAGTAVGTPAYMSPEQAAGELDRLGPTTDVYSLGATLYCLLTGRAPFDEAELGELLLRVQRGAVTPPRAVKTGVPPALEAICLKAMSPRPEGRYASPRALADDIEHWLADEPVSPHREGWADRLVRWARRHRAQVAAAVASLLVAGAAGGYLLYERLAHANDLVDTLLVADLREVPRIVERLRRDRHLVRGRLRTLAAAGRAEPAGLRAALALLPDDPAMADELVTRLLSSRPDELIIIRLALRDRASRPALSRRFWALLEGAGARLTDRQLRALGALALFDAGSPRWRALGTPLAVGLVREDPQLIGDWREVFQPVGDRLAPPLRQVYGGPAPPEERSTAFRLLLDFALQPGNLRREEDLADLIAEADPAQFRQILGGLTDRRRALDRLEAQLSRPARFDEARARRQGRIAAALVVLGRAEAVWPLLRHDEDPSLRTEILHDLAPYGASPRAVVDRLLTEPDTTARRALLLCLGEFDPAAIARSEREALVARLLGWYRDDADSGVHSAVDWLLRRRWRRGADLDRADQDLRGRAGPGRDWFLNTEGQTLAIVRGPVEFRMGSPLRESGREYDETYHRVRIDRSFAMTTTEVTVAQFRRSPGRDDPRRGDRRESYGRFAPTPDCPMVGVDWYDAARYCNWLSRREGLPEDQWCYPEPIGPGMDLPPDYLRRRGYRLPTEAEWEYACRAGATTARFFGEQSARLRDYCWYAENSGGRAHPVGALKPNDRGLFDTYGNVWEWGQDPFEMIDPALPDRVHRDRGHPGAVTAEGIRVLRGGSFNYQAVYLRSADRDWNLPGARIAAYGFRVARTWP